jgi:hypothetical protein
MKITEIVVTIRIPAGKTKTELADMINKGEILEWIPRNRVKYQDMVEAGNAADEKIVHVRFQNPA